MEKSFHHETDKKQSFLPLLGICLNFTIFTLFGLFLPVLSPLFFPEKDLLAALLYGYLFFAVGFFAYPLGALLFGHIGDKFGCKKALSLSIGVMAIPTFLIGALPSYETFGILAPVFYVSAGSLKASAQEESIMALGFLSLTCTRK